MRSGVMQMENGGQKIKAKPGNSARGWNDPPQFLYDTGTPTGHPQTNIAALKKRVGHNLLGPSLTPQGVSQGVLHSVPLRSSVEEPGMPITSVIKESLPAISVIDTQSLAHARSEFGTTGSVKSPPANVVKSPPANIDAPEFTNNVEQLSYCVQCFHDTSSLLVQCQLLEVAMAENIKKRISLFSQHWMVGKLSGEAKSKCSRLARALELKDFASANVYHMQLMTDHISEVNQWMVGIKKLVQTGQELVSVAKVDNKTQEDEPKQESSVTGTDTKESFITPSP